MDAMMLSMRLIHILFGVFWAGTIFFLVSYLQPVLADAGPQAGQIMKLLRQRKFFERLPVAAGLTILSGLYLYWRVSGGFSPEWSASPPGVTLSIGALAALVAFAIGMLVMRKSTLQLLDIAASLPPEGPTSEQQAQMNALRARSRAAARSVAALLTIAVVAMAVARYVH